MLTNISQSKLKKMNLKKIKTYADICKIDGVDPIKSLPFPEAKTAEETAVNSFAMTIRINRVLNEGWQPDWNNSREYKYYPWFYMRSDSQVGSGVGFSYYDYSCVHSDSAVGSRLVFKTETLAKFAGTTFLEVYRGFMVIEK
jgi:hypothetical protein